MKSLVVFVEGIIVAILHDLWPAIKTILKFLFQSFMACVSGSKPPKTTVPCSCTSIKHPSFFQPDPMIYDQYYLMGLGLAVSWQNPDIQILQGGVPVASAYDLKTSTTYTIQATIYNASTTGVVFQMPVVFSYLSFGIATISTEIPGPTPTVNLGVKGTPEGIAVAEMEWTTPAIPGHYCIQVSFAWPDDANPFNNLGQENTQVVPAFSPAPIAFQLRNANRSRKQVRFDVDTYEIPPPPPCVNTVLSAATGTASSGMLPAATRARNSRAMNPLPSDWTITFTPATPVLNPGEEITIAGVITPPNSFHGSMNVNIHAFADLSLMGGVTIIVNRA